MFDFLEFKGFGENPRWPPFWLILSIKLLWVYGELIISMSADINIHVAWLGLQVDCVYFGYTKFGI